MLTQVQPKCSPATIFSLFFFNQNSKTVPDSEPLQLLYTLPRMLFPQIHAQLLTSPFSFPSNLFSDIFLLVKLPDHIILTATTPNTPYLFSLSYLYLCILLVWFFFLICFSQMKPKFHVSRYLTYILWQMVCPHHEKIVRVILAPNYTCPVKRNS